MKITEFKLTELKSACKAAGAKGYSALSKSELIEWIAASPRSAEILAALPGATSIECMEGKSSIEEKGEDAIIPASELNKAWETVNAGFEDAIAPAPGEEIDVDAQAAKEVDAAWEALGEDEEHILVHEDLIHKSRIPYYSTGKHGNTIQPCDDCECLSVPVCPKCFFVEGKGNAIAAPPSECMDENLEEEIDPETWEHFKLIQCIRTLAASLGAEAVVSAEGTPIEFTNQALASCSMSQLEFIFGKLTELSQFVGADNSEPIPDSELSEDEREANAFGAKFVADFLEGDAAPEPEPFPYKWEDLVELKFAVPPVNGIALSVRQPWCWAIFFAEKDIENRTWATDYRGPLWIHASKTYDHEGAEWLARKFGERIPGPDDLPLGAIVGRVDLVDCSQSLPVDENGEENSWAIPGQFFWKLAEAFPCTPIPYKGQLGLFKFEIDAPQPPPQHLRDRAMGITNFDEKQPNGESFCPSNGTIGDIFESLWCEQCRNFTQSGCRIYVEALAGEPPAEWQYWDGAPLCTGFEEGIPPEEPITPPPPPEASTACPIFYPGDVVQRFIEPYIVAGPDKERPGNWLVRSQDFPEGGEFSLNLLWNHLVTPSKAYQFPKEPQSQFSLWSLAVTHAHKIRLMDGWDNRDIAARLQDSGFQFSNRIWDFCEFEGYEFLFSEFVTCGQWVIGRSGCAIVACWDPHLFIWQIESQDLDFWVEQIKSWQSEWNEPILNSQKTLLKATA